MSVYDDILKELGTVGKDREGREGCGCKIQKPKDPNRIKPLEILDGINQIDPKKVKKFTDKIKGLSGDSGKVEKIDGLDDDDAYDGIIEDLKGPIEKVKI